MLFIWSCGFIQGYGTEVEMDDMIKFLMDSSTSVSSTIIKFHTQITSYDIALFDLIVVGNFWIY